MKISLRIVKMAFNGESGDLGSRLSFFKKSLIFLTPRFFTCRRILIIVFGQRVVRIQ